MTREEALSKSPYSQNDYTLIINRIYDLFEQRIGELESPKTCEGCSEYGLNIGNGYDRDYCTKLNRFTHDAFGCVYYEPKEQE